MAVVMKWVKVKSSNPPIYLEDRGNGEYARYYYSVLGPIAHAGRLNPGIEVESITKKDLKEVELIEKMIKEGIERTKAFYTAMKLARGEEVKI